jgi:RNA polymerase sigma-70 factor (ECF subfamily)
MNSSPGRTPSRGDAVDGRAGGSVAGGPDMPDELVSRAMAADPRAVEALIARIRPMIERYCRARLGRLDRTDVAVDDVVQEVCLAVLTALPGYRGHGRSFLAFVYGIASGKVVDALRAGSRSVPVADVPDLADDVDDPGQRLLGITLADRLSGLLDMLPETQREILVLRLAMGLSVLETAEAVGTTPGAVRVAQHRALARFRTMSIGEGAAPPDVIELLAELDDESLRRGYLAFVGALESALDLDSGLVHLEDRHGHRGFVAGLAGRLNLDAGLDALLRSTAKSDS